MKPADLVLRDVHLPPAPTWWPLAPGWWWLAGLLAMVVLFFVVRHWRRRQRRRRWLRWFDESGLGHAPAAQVAAMSDLLRRAAREVDSSAVRLSGEAWLRFLDGDTAGAFSQGDGRLLLDGGYRREVDLDAVARLRGLARARFLQLMAGKR
ncbi:DUF4381 domain-containing protein [Pseudoxanthomonas sp. z9]|uniref:DUF4381 domain-containing protein n=1 Tax=Pseudoxanthomonas sp. z9 TaxID=2584942 RepID=UPI001142B581|nr:DUF4381 domain-containing protein [Pseudoxanthomonas sp. z9]MCL6713681.1 DUF4381 domain-containing protein [Pseudomonas sp. R2.Fl]